MSAISDVFLSLPKRFVKGSVKATRTFYFSLGEEKWAVTLTPEACEVTQGKPAQDADVFFKASSEMFVEVWNGRYTPTAKDFLTGAIKSNNPLALKDFVAAFK